MRTVSTAFRKITNRDTVSKCNCVLIRFHRDVMNTLEKNEAKVIMKHVKFMIATMDRLLEILLWRIQE
jgi:hypothetical protein